MQSRSQTTLSHELLLVYAIYRLALTLVIWVLFLTDTAVGQDHPKLFVGASLFYLASNVALLQAATSKWQPRFFTLFLTVASDIIAIQLIAQSSGDISSGVSVLMVISVAAGSLFLQSNKVFLVPSFASISLLLSVTATVLYESTASVNGLVFEESTLSNYTRSFAANSDEVVASGWLGILFFLASALVAYLSSRVEKSDLRAQQEYEHAQNLQHLNSLIIDRMQTGILIVDRSGKLISHNQAAEELLRPASGKGFNTLSQIDGRLEEFLNSILSSLSHNIPFNTPQNSNDTSAIKPEPLTLHLEYSGKNLKFIWINLRDSSNAEFLVFIEDLSKIAQQAQQLKLSSLGKLTASIAHEIRNPLGAASHAAQLLQESDQNTENRRLAEIIIKQTQRCSSVIESVLDVSRGGQSKVQQFDLAAWLPTLISDYKIANRCEIDLRGEESLIVRFDQSQLTQILSNLLDNALRHGVEVDGMNHVTLYASIDRQQRARLDVLDTGDGVAPSNIEALFEPFFTTASSGSGLGLYICRELCEANQATIKYIQHPYQGLTADAASKISSACKLDHCFRIEFAHPDRTPIFANNS